jgi:ribosomal protein L27
MNSREKREAVRPGDIIYAERGAYRHFGIYTGNGRAVHYTLTEGVAGLRMQIRETSFAKFAKGDDVYVLRIRNTSGVKCYSPEETVRRARSMIGAKNYNLVFNNCEHFAFWCKTGVSRSEQVEQAFADVAITIGAPVLEALDKLADAVYAIATI